MSSVLKTPRWVRRTHHDYVITPTRCNESVDYTCLRYGFPESLKVTPLTISAVGFNSTILLTLHLLFGLVSTGTAQNKEASGRRSLLRGPHCLTIDLGTCTVNVRIPQFILPMAGSSDFEGLGLLVWIWMGLSPKDNEIKFEE